MKLKEPSFFCAVTFLPQVYPRFATVEIVGLYFKILRLLPSKVGSLLLLFFCMNLGLPFSLIHDLFFTQAFGNPLQRHAPATSVVQMAEYFQAWVETKIRGEIVALAVDGWTKWSPQKMINFGIFWEKQANFFGIQCLLCIANQGVFGLAQHTTNRIEARCPLYFPPPFLF